MSGKFNGFSQEDISKLSIKDKENLKTNPRPHINKRISDKMIVPKSITNKIVKEQQQQQISCENESTDNSLDSTIQSLQDAIHFKPLPPKIQQIHNTSDNILKDNYCNNDNDEDNDNEIQNKNSPFKGISLKDFEAQRRMVEEQNKEKKKMLYKAIEQHSERTAAEAKKLQEIKIELQKLDSELAADVAILRKQIEIASIDYMQSQQYYQKVENQFLKAKIELHQASEKKELLTEHLCTIISHNEDRKAKKLTELMEKVGLSENQTTKITTTHTDVDNIENNLKTSKS